MLFDSQAAFAKGTALSTAGTGTTLLGTVMDLQVDGQNIGVTPQPMFVWCGVSTAITAAATATLQLQLVTADSADLTSSPVVVLQTLALDAASGIAQGTELLNISLPITTYKRYLGMRQVIAAAAVTAGGVYALLTREPGNWQAYAENSLAH